MRRRVSDSSGASRSLRARSEAGDIAVTGQAIEALVSIDVVSDLRCGPVFADHFQQLGTDCRVVEALAGVVELLEHDVEEGPVDFRFLGAHDQGMLGAGYIVSYE